MAKLIRIRSNFVFELDLEDPRLGHEKRDIVEFLLKKYNEDNEGEPITSLTADDCDDAALHDVIRKALEEDVETILDMDEVNDANSFDIEVLNEKGDQK